MAAPPLCARMATAGSGAGARLAFRALFPLLRPLLRSDMELTRDEVEASRGRLAGHLDRLEDEIGPSGHIVGETFTVADLAAAAVMTAIVRPPGFPYPLPEPWPAALVALREGISRRPGFRWVLDMYERHRSPSAEAAGP